MSTDLTATQAQIERDMEEAEREAQELTAALRSKQDRAERLRREFERLTGYDPEQGRKQVLTIYLGTPEFRLRRTNALRLISEELTEGNLSRLIQQIADGDLLITRPEA